MRRILIPALLVLGLTAAACGTTEKTAEPGPTATSSTPTTTSAPPTSDPGDVTFDEPLSAPTTEKPAAPAEPAMTSEQEQAVGTANDYLDYTHFSRSGLIKQLIYEGYSKKNATYAVDHIDVSWNEQAAGAALDYLDYSHFSRSGLIEQLEYEGYTHSQAVYGVNKAGL